MALLALVSTWVAAQTGPGSTNALIPYSGYLESDGAAVTTPVDLRVGLFPSPSGTSCLASPTLSGCGVWADQMTDVPVTDGRFSVMLGSGVPLSDDVFAEDALYVGVAVAPPGGAFTVLAGAQRLASVPYAVRTETAPDLYVAGSIGVRADPNPGTAIHVENGALYVRDDDNDATADIARFFAQNLTQGVGIGYNRIEAVGSNASQDLVLRSKDARVIVEGNHHVTGNAAVDGTLTVDDGILEPVIRNRDGATSMYYREGGRYLVEATYQNATPTRRYVPIPDSVLLSYCGDEDGCTVRIGMRGYAAGNPVSTSMGPFAFSYVQATNGSRHWRRAESLGTSNPNQSVEASAGQDGDNSVQHVVRDHDCFFTDASYTAGGGGSDNGVGMGLLNYNINSYVATCWLIIDD